MIECCCGNTIDRRIECGGCGRLIEIKRDDNRDLNMHSNVAEGLMKENERLTAINAELLAMIAEILTASMSTE